MSQNILIINCNTQLQAEEKNVQTCMLNVLSEWNYTVISII